MSIIGFMLRIFLLLLPVFCISTNSYGQSLHLKAAGDNQNGYHVEIYSGNQLMVTNTEEFSIRFFNTDASTTAFIPSWKGEKWSGNDTSITLTRNSYLPDFDANLSVSVNYEIVNSNVVKKTIQLFQPSMTDLYYILEQTSRPPQIPLKYITFEYDNFPGGMVHEMYPAAGWVTPDNKVVGFLTDAGYKNQFTRTTRRRFSGRGGGFVGMRLLPDPNLYAVATRQEQSDGKDFIRQTFGEMYNLDAGSSQAVKAGNAWNKEGNVEVVRNDSLISLVCQPGGRAGIEFIAPFKDQKIYTISFLCKGNSPVALKLFRLRNGFRTTELEEGVKYIDNFPANEQEWTLFKGSILIPYIEQDSVEIFIGTQSGKEAWLQIKDLQFTEHQPKVEAYNQLLMGQSSEKTTYIFVEPYTNHKNFMISAQTRLAEGKDLKVHRLKK
jgi:hypothetical protein